MTEHGKPLSPLCRRRRSVGAALVLATLLIADPGLAQTGLEPEQVTPPTEKVTIERASGDSQIDRRLTRILEASGWFANPRIEVREGIVFLDGSTASEAHKEWAGTVAEKTQEVVAVVNRIDVKPKVSWDFSPAWKELNRLALKTQQTLPFILLGLVILLITWQLSTLAARLARWAFSERISSPLMLMVTARAIALPVFILGLYLVLQIFGLTRLALTVLGGTGLIGVALGFAFRDIVENFLASLLLSIRNPFRAGDYIQLQEHEGIVKNLNTRSTVLLTLDGNHVQIPNATVFKSVITNFSTNPSRRDAFIVGIGYDDSTSTAQNIIEEVLAAHPAVLHEPSPFVVVHELAASTVNLKVSFWFDSTTYSPVKLRSALMRQIKRALLEGGISMPDEAREVIFPQGLPIYRGEPPKPKKKSSKAADAAAEDLEDSSPAEGGLDTEDDEVLREARTAATPEEKENLLTGASGG